MIRNLKVFVVLAGLSVVGCEELAAGEQAATGVGGQGDEGDEAVDDGDRAIATGAGGQNDEGDEAVDDGDRAVGPLVGTKDAAVFAEICTKPRQIFSTCTSVRDIIVGANAYCEGGRVDVLQYIETADCPSGAPGAVASCCYPRDLQAPPKAPTPGDAGLVIRDGGTAAPSECAPDKI